MSPQIEPFWWVVTWMPLSEALGHALVGCHHAAAKILASPLMASERRPDQSANSGAGFP
jgi:hypothetical protein